VLYVGLQRRRTSEDDREWWGRAGGWLAHGGHAVAGWPWTGVLRPPALLALGATTATAVVSLGGLTGVVTAVWGYRSKLKLSDLGKATSQVRDVLGRVGPMLGTVIFALILLLVVSLATSFVLNPVAHLSSGVERQTQAYHDILTRTPPGWVLVIMLVCAAVALAARG